MLERGDLVPHFTLTTLDGASVRYTDLWQQSKLVLVVLEAQPDAPGDAAYAADLAAARDELRELGAALVVTRESLTGAPPPCVLIADQWGEIHLVESGRTVADLPEGEGIREWLEYIHHQCPECQGEAG